MVKLLADFYTSQIVTGVLLKCRVDDRQEFLRDCAMHREPVVA